MEKSDDMKQEINKKMETNGYQPYPEDLSNIELSEEFKGYIDGLSERSHQRWYERRLAEGGTIDRYPNLKPWKELTELQKDDTRSQYVELFKFVQAKCRLTSDVIDDISYRTSDGYYEAVSSMARNAHEVWAENKIKAGWTYGQVKNVNTKTTPDLREYEELSDADRSYDIDVAMDVVNFLEEKGVYLKGVVHLSTDLMDYMTLSKENETAEEVLRSMGTSFIDGSSEINASTLKDTLMNMFVRDGSSCEYTYDELEYMLAYGRQNYGMTAEQCDDVICAFNVHVVGIPSKMYIHNSVTAMDAPKQVFKAGKMYIGGSEASGFFGASSGVYSPQELEEITKRMTAEIAERNALNIPEDLKERSRLAGDPNTSSEMHAALAKDEDSEFSLNVATNPHTPAETLAKLATSRYLATRMLVAQNVNTPAKSLVELAEDRNEGVRQCAIKNPKLPIHTLLRMGGPYSHIGESIIEHPETITAVVKEMKPEFRRYVAYNFNTPVETLEELANDEYPDVRSGVAKNPNTPAQTLAKLAKDKYPDVDSDVLSNVARNSNTPAQTLAELAMHMDEIVRIAVASNPKTPTATLSELAKDKDESVRQAVTENETYKNHIDIETKKKTEEAPATTVSKLMKDEYEIVRQANAEEAASRRTAETAAKPSIPEDLKSRMASAVNSGKIDSFGEFRDGLSRVSRNGKYNYANEDGQLLAIRWFDSATEFQGGRATITRDGTRAEINTAGIALAVQKIEQTVGCGPKLH